MNDGLKDQQRNAMLGVLKQHPKIERAVLFGSRAMGTFTPTSDIDVALYGDLTLRDQAKIADELEQLPIPFTVDLVRMKTVTSPELLAHIKEHGKKLELGGGSEWEELTLGDFVTLQRGHDLTDPQRRPGGVPVMGSAGQNGFHDTARAIGPGIVIGRSGASFGQVHFSNDDYWPHNTALYVTDFKGNDPKFAFYFLKAIDFSCYNSGSAQPSLNRNFIYPIPVRIPPLPEQKRIAHILGTLDDKIELNRRMNATLEAMARALFQSWFVDFDPVRRNAEGGESRPEDALFPDSFEDSAIGEIPTGWKTMSLYETAIYRNGAPFKPVDFCSSEDGLPVVKIAELKNGLSDQTKWSNKQLGSDQMIDTGDLLYSWSGSPDTSLDVFLWNNGPGLVNQHIFKVITSSGAKKCFVYYLLKHLRPILVETARDKQTTGLGHVTVADMKRLQVCRPPTDVLVAFDRLIAPIFDEAFAYTVESQTLATLRDILLPKLMNGSMPHANKLTGIQLNK